MAVRDAAGATKNMPDRMAGPHRDPADDRDHRLPGTDLALEAGFQVRGIGLGARQPLDEQAERIVRQAIGEVVRLVGGERFHRMIDRPDAGRQPQPFGRVQRDGGIEHHHDRGHVAMLIALLVRRDLVGRARQGVELSAGQGGGDANRPNVGSDLYRIDHSAVAIDEGAQRLEILDRPHVVLEQQRHDLARVDDRATPDADDQVRSGGACGLGCGENVRARRVRGDPAMRGGVTIAQRDLNLCDFVGIAAQTVGGQQEHLACAHRLGLCAKRVARGLPHRDALGRRKSHLGRNDARHGLILSRISLRL
ncbi:hypothetical protein D9M73_141720 [compost metagenome]